MPEKAKVTRKLTAKDRVVNDRPETRNADSRNIQTNKQPKKLWPFILLFFVIFISAAFLYKNKSLIVAGTVNGKPVFTMEINQKLLKQYGKQTLDQIIVEYLVNQEAKKRNIQVTESEIDAKIAEIENNIGGKQKLEDALKQQGMTTNELREQQKLILTATKLITDKITVTDQDIDNYIKERKMTLDKKTDQAVQRENIKLTLIEEKKGEELQKLVTDLKSQAKIVTFL